MRIEFSEANCLMQNAVADGIFPGAVLLVANGDKIVFHHAYGMTDLETRYPVTTETFFDLASLTKPLATTLAVVQLIQCGKLELTSTLGELIVPLAGSAKSAITIRHLLRHRSGLPAYREYFRTLAEIPLENRSAALHQLLIKEPLSHTIDTQTEYSDLGFLLLQWVVESVSGRRLDQLVVDIYRQLSLYDLFFINWPMGMNAAKSQIFAATEKCDWRQKVLQGEVHDENAYALGGIAGHAGLFGKAGAVHILLAELLASYHGHSHSGIFDTKLIRTFLAPPADNEKALGFDRPSQPNSSSGRFFSSFTVGHLGFTGTSFWMDLQKHAIIILLTNRIHPTRKNERIRSFRPDLHDAIMRSVDSTFRP